MTRAARISLVTLGVDDVARASAFYERLGFEKSIAASQPGVTFFKAGGVVLALFGRRALSEDAGLGDDRAGQGAFALAQNLDSEDAVDAFMARAAEAGATMLKPAAATSWGGYGGYFADPDGHLWEIAYNPHFPVLPNGSLLLPD